MRDQRLRVFRVAVDGLMESLDATVRLSRWSADEPKPEPLVAAAAKLMDRLGTAGRLASSTFSGAPADVAKVTAMRTAMKRLDAAHLAYCKTSGSPADKAEAASTLEAEVSATATAAEQWA